MTVIRMSLRICPVKGKLNSAEQGATLSLVFKKSSFLLPGAYANQYIPGKLVKGIPRAKLPSTVPVEDWITWNFSGILHFLGRLHSLEIGSGLRNSPQNQGGISQSPVMQHEYSSSHGSFRTSTWIVNMAPISESMDILLVKCAYHDIDDGDTSQQGRSDLNCREDRLIFFELPGILLAGS